MVYFQRLMEPSGFQNAVQSVAAYWNVIKTVLRSTCVKLQMSPPRMVGYFGEYIACQRRNELERSPSKNSDLNKTNCDKEFQKS